MDVDYRDLPPIPTYRIDLSLPPRERYKKLTTDFAPRMRALTPIFDEVLDSFILNTYILRVVRFLARLFLRRLFSQEETEELRGISQASGVDMFIIVALNVLLDSLLGCTSGGVMVRAKQRKGKSKGAGNEEGQLPRMMHFRTLDWGMDGLRSLLVILEFVRSKSSEPEKVIVRSITYAGFVGVLTGVRENLSISLNFRPNHSCSNLSLRLHQLLVLTGFRPSVASILRSTILPTSLDIPPSPLKDVATTLASRKTSPCYLIICDGMATKVIEKDLVAYKVRSSNEFVVHTNHDTDSSNTSERTSSENHETSIVGVDDWIEESEERQACVQTKWNKIKQRQKKNSTGYATVSEIGLKGWLRAFPIMNECSHFGCIMDPQSGSIRFLERGVVQTGEVSDA